VQHGLSQSGLSKQQDPIALFEFSFSGEGGIARTAADDSSKFLATYLDERTLLSRNALDNCISGASTIGGSTDRPAAGDPVGRDRKTLCVEYSHAELYTFFDQLERIQHQLDALT